MIAWLLRWRADYLEAGCCEQFLGTKLLMMKQLLKKESARGWCCASQHVVLGGELQLAIMLLLQKKQSANTSLWQVWQWKPFATCRTNHKVLPARLYQLASDSKVSAQPLLLSMYVGRATFLLGWLGWSLMGFQLQITLSLTVHVFIHIFRLLPHHSLCGFLIAALSIESSSVLDLLLAQ